MPPTPYRVTSHPEERGAGSAGGPRQTELPPPVGTTHSCKHTFSPVHLLDFDVSVSSYYQTCTSCPACVMSLRQPAVFILSPSSPPSPKISRSLSCRGASACAKSIPEVIFFLHSFLPVCQQSRSLCGSRTLCLFSLLEEI